MERFCQSCGMPLKNHQGTNLDGLLSSEYCLYCWKDGMFLQPDIKTGKEMQDYVYRLLKEEYKSSSLKAWFLTLNIPSLKRWKK